MSGTKTMMIGFRWDKSLIHHWPMYQPNWTLNLTERTFDDLQSNNAGCVYFLSSWSNASLLECEWCLDFHHGCHRFNACPDSEELAWFNSNSTLWRIYARLNTSNLDSRTWWKEPCLDIFMRHSSIVYVKTLFLFHRQVSQWWSQLHL